MARFPGLPLEAKAQRNHSVRLIIGSGNSDWRATFWQKKIWPHCAIQSENKKKPPEGGSFYETTFRGRIKA
ncbi:MAG: hypothetical protein CRN43_11280 [Candidatus Nephrothrix sp. EaCA]|nr:MAG: hypothetical protein CRN43_11280 [Candidatus Nephrothrix sp. EaCA]